MTDNLWAEAAEEQRLAPPPPPATPRPLWPILLLVAALLGGGIWAWYGRVANAGPVLNIGSQRGGTKALMLASGALKGAPYHVQWSEFPAAQTLLEAIGAGAVDIGLVGDAPFQFAYQSGQPIVAVAAQTAQGRPAGALAILVPKASPVRTLRDLAGKRIATTRGSIGHYLILKALEREGMKPDAVRITFLSPGDTKAAFDSGSIDAWATWSPYTASAIAGGARVVADGRDYMAGYGFDAANVRSVADKRALIADFERRQAKALVWAKTHPQDYGRVLARETGLPYPIALFHASHLPRTRGPFDAALKTEERDVVATFRRAGLLAGDRPLDQAYRPIE
jgi:sulfonate transport system substrate-binding protein